VPVAQSLDGEANRFAGVARAQEVAMQRVDPAWMLCCVVEVVDGPAGGNHRLGKDLPTEHPAVGHRLAAPDEDVDIGFAELGIFRPPATSIAERAVG